ncbi:uncharacterized oxidoreductase YrbE-like [Argopecten irradians]|uniref:uncharacterized oxidoreductase YrbE-like n=1 Tax=Argopecten irradians TaxID=31199 RepID=UPI00371DD3BA
MSSKIEIGAALLGVGRIGQVHLKNLVDISSFRILWMVDVKENHKTMDGLISRYRLHNETRITTPDELDKVMEDSRVKVVVICTPTSFHEHAIMKSLKSDKHVFCEKPLAPSLDSVKACYAEAYKQQKTLFCALNRRFDPQLRHIRDELLAGNYGRPRVIKMTSHELGQPMEYYKYSTGGIFLDMAIHDIDYVCWLAGGRPTSVMATGVTSSDSAENYKRIGDYDSASAILTFPNGVIGHLNLVRESGYGYSQTVEVLGTKKIAKSKNMMVSEVECSCLDDGTNIGKMTDSFLTRYQESFRIEMEHFLEVIQGKAVCDVTSESYIIASEVSGQLTTSARTGQVVTL